MKLCEGSSVSVTNKTLLREERALTSAAHRGATNMFVLSGTNMFVPNKRAQSAVSCNSLKS